jgi:hypothetical protein
MTDLELLADIHGDGSPTAAHYKTMLVVLY